jgi:sugar lactone lactonase YvrE
MQNLPIVAVNSETKEDDMGELAAGEYRKIASGIYLEGLSVDYRRNVIWYSDVISGGIHGVTPEGEKVCSFNEDRMWTGGVYMNEDGSVLSTGQYGIMWNNPDTGKSGWLLDELEGKPINGINEIAPDGAGGILFGTNDIENIILGQPARPSTLYRLTADREVIKLAEGIGFANGVMHDAGRKRFYCNDTFSCTWVFDVTENLSLANKRLLLEKEDVDGMTLDADGNVWITGFRSNFLTRVQPGGDQLPRIATPVGSITQIRFGGADMKDYYITLVPADGGDTLKEGGELTQKNSHLYRGRSEVAGMPLASARFRLG